MITFTLKCSRDHNFDSWFRSARAFENLKAAKMLGCPVCGDAHIAKAIMAPRVRPSRTAAQNPAAGAKSAPPNNGKNLHALTAPSSPAEAAMIELKKKIQQHSEYVGSEFATEARAIHDGDARQRSIYGEANCEDARKLIEDGVPVAPLPFIPTRKSN
jgi:hypothetical protein